MAEKLHPVLAVWKHPFDYSWSKRNNPLGLLQLNLRHDGDRDSRRLARSNPCRHAMRGGVQVNRRQTPFIRRSQRAFIAASKHFQCLSAIQRKTALSIRSGLFSLVTLCRWRPSVPPISYTCVESTDGVDYKR